MRGWREMYATGVRPLRIETSGWERVIRGEERESLSKKIFEVTFAREVKGLEMG